MLSRYGHYKSSVKIWDLENGDVSTAYVYLKSVLFADISALSLHDASLVYVLDRTTLCVRNLCAHEELAQTLQLPEEGGHYQSSAVSESHILVSWESADLQHKWVTVWERTSWRRTLDIEAEAIRSDVHLWEDRILYRTSNGPIVIRNASTGDVIHEIPVPNPGFDVSVPSSVRFVGSPSRIVFSQCRNTSNVPGRPSYRYLCFVLDESPATGVWCSRAVDLGLRRAVDGWSISSNAADALVCYVHNSVQLFDLATRERAAIGLNSQMHVTELAACGQRILVRAEVRTLYYDNVVDDTNGEEEVVEWSIEDSSPQYSVILYTPV